MSDPCAQGGRATLGADTLAETWREQVREWAQILASTRHHHSQARAGEQRFGPTEVVRPILGIVTEYRVALADDRLEAGTPPGFWSIIDLDDLRLIQREEEPSLRTSIEGIVVTDDRAAIARDDAQWWRRCLHSRCRVRPRVWLAWWHGSRWLLALRESWLRRWCWRRGYLRLLRSSVASAKHNDYLPPMR